MPIERQIARNLFFAVLVCIPFLHSARVEANSWSSYSTFRIKNLVEKAASGEDHNLGFLLAWALMTEGSSRRDEWDEAFMSKVKSLEAASAKALDAKAAEWMEVHDDFVQLDADQLALACQNSINALADTGIPLRTRRAKMRLAQSQRTWLWPKATLIPLTEMTGWPDEDRASISRSLALAGQSAEARRLLPPSMVKPSWQYVAALAALGEFELAYQSTTKIRDGLYRSRALTEAVCLQSRLGQVDAALLNAISSDERYGDRFSPQIIRELIGRQAERGDMAGLQESLEGVDRNSDTFLTARIWAAHHQADLKTLSWIADHEDSYSLEALRGLVKGMAHFNEHGRAVKALMTLEKPIHRISIGLRLIRELGHDSQEVAAKLLDSLLPDLALAYLEEEPEELRSLWKELPAAMAVAGRPQEALRWVQVVPQAFDSQGIRSRRRNDPTTGAKFQQLEALISLTETCLQPADGPLKQVEGHYLTKKAERYLESSKPKEHLFRVRAVTIRQFADDKKDGTAHVHLGEKEPDVWNDIEAARSGNDVVVLEAYAPPYKEAPHDAAFRAVVEVVTMIKRSDVEKHWAHTVVGKVREIEFIQSR